VTTGWLFWHWAGVCPCTRTSSGTSRQQQKAFCLKGSFHKNFEDEPRDLVLKAFPVPCQQVIVLALVWGVSMKPDPDPDPKPRVVKDPDPTKNC
jgi:hypothetical protein